MADSTESAGEVTSAEGAERTQTTVADLPEEALTIRLARERKAGSKEAENALISRLGMSPEDAAKALQEFQALKDASKSEAQRLQEERDALKPRASRADLLEKRVAELSEVEYGLLTDEQKALTDDLANNADGTVDHDARLRVIASLKRRGVLSGKQAEVLKDGASTSSAKPAPKTESEPEPNSPEFHYAKWKSLPEGVLKTAYMNDHAGAIRQAKAYGSAN